MPKSDFSDVSSLFFLINKRFAHAPNLSGNTFRHVAKASNPSGNNFRHARKRQTTRETTFAKRENAKPFGKRLSPSAEMQNPSGNDFRHARKCKTLREIAFAMRGNAKPFGKWLSPSAENFFFVFLQCAEAWKTSFWPFCSVQQREKLLFSLSAVCRSVKIFFLAFLQCAEAWKTSF